MAADESVFYTKIGNRHLTPRQLAILITAAEDEGASQVVLARRNGVNRSTMVVVAHRLKRMGLLRLGRNKKDARASVVKLTDKGRRILRAAAPLARRANQRVLKALSNRQRKDFIAALVSIVAVVPRRQKRGATRLPWHRCIFVHESKQSMASSLKGSTINGPTCRTVRSR